MGVSLKTPVVSADPRQAALERVLASAPFRRSPQSSELLVYLCRCAMSDSREGISEHQIAVDVYDRTPSYNSNEDTIVRVQVSQLRKKLQYYYLSEGAQDPLRIAIPVGSYVPGFLPHDAAPPEIARTAPRTLVPALLALLVLACALLGYQNYNTLRRAAGPAAAPAPNLQRLWMGLFLPARPLQVVLSDSSLLNLSDILGRRVTLADYRNPLFPQRFLENNISDGAALSSPAK